MEAKPLYQTKTFWTGVIGVAVMVAGYILDHVDLGSTIFAVVICATSIFLRQGLPKEVSDQISAIQKSLTQSKTFYASIFGMAGAAGAYFSGEIELGPAIATVISGLEVIFLRNPKLRGCCCKHVIKTLAVLQQSAALLLIEKEMQRQAKKKGWFTKLLGKKTPGARYTDKDTLRAMEAPGGPSAVDIEDAFRKFNMAKLGIKKKMSEPSMRKRLEEAVVKEKTFQGIAKQERRRAESAERRADQAVKDKIVAELDTRLVKAKYVDKIPEKEAIKQYADKMGMTVEAITAVAREANLL